MFDSWGRVFAAWGWWGYGFKGGIKMGGGMLIWEGMICELKYYVLSLQLFVLYMDKRCCLGIVHFDYMIKGRIFDRCV